MRSSKIIHVVSCHAEGEVGDVIVGGVAPPAIIPSISGRAWITGIHQHLLDPSDPWPGGYRLSDTWPNGPEGSAMP